MNYIYSYRDIIKSVIRYLSLTTTKSKLINPLFIGTRLNSADFEDAIICFWDCMAILKQVYNKKRIFIFMGLMDGYTEKQIAEVLECSRQNINWHKNNFIKEVRRIQKHGK